jgi:phosphatidylinositol alpha-1,6-mannosyltransferase
MLARPEPELPAEGPASLTIPPRPSLVLAVTNAWPPMAAGSGRALHGMISHRADTLVLAPRAASAALPTGGRILPIFRFSQRAGGPLKIHSALQHLEIVLVPLLWCAGRARSRRPAAIVACQPLFAGVGALLACRWLGIPYLVLVHGEELTTWRTDAAPFQLRLRLLRATLGRAAAVLCNSCRTRRLAHELYGVPMAMLHVIHPAVTASQSEGAGVEEVAATRQRFVGENARMLLMVGRLAEAHKGFDTGIRALPAVLAGESEARLVIAGPGDQSSLRALARSVGVEDKVIFVGHAGSKTIAALFAACDLFLLPGREVAGSAEGFGVVFLEAALAGKAVIGGRAGGAPEAVADGETGLLVDGGSPPEVAAAVLRLLRDPAYAARLGRRGRERAMAEFDGRLQHEQFEQVLQAVLRLAGTP